mgnify:FL=1
MKMFRFVQLRYQIFFSCILVAVIPLLLTSFFLVRIFDMSLKRQALSEGLVQSREASELFDGLLSDCVLACQSLDQSAATILIDSKNDAIMQELYMSLYTAASSLGTDAVFSIYDVGGMLRFTTDSQVADPALTRYDGLLKSLIGMERKVYYYTPAHEGEHESRFQAAYPIENEGGMRTGILVLDFSEESLEDLFRGCHGSGSTLILRDPLGQPVYSSNRNLSYEEQQELLLEAEKTDRAGEFERDSNYAYLQTGTGSGYSIVHRISPPISAASVDQMRELSLFMSLACLPLCLLMAMALSRRISRPIKRLVDGMRQVRKGDLDVQVPVESQDELGELTSAFNRMTMDLRRYVDERVEQQKALSAARLKLYQTQLNPHFLYNTLDTIKWSARIHGLTDIAVMAENLAGILRQALSSQEFVTLKEELETIDSYMAIQKARLPEGFQYEAEVPDSLMSARVPKMLLQPLVENAVLHGVEHDGDGYICIFAVQEGSDLKISVFDDGLGMPPEIVRWINSPEPEKREGHLGLYNLISILKIHYGEGYGLKARSGDGEGTTITITLPMEAKHV